jgi:hypothetical protein
MSKNETLNIEFVKKNLDKDWNWSYLSKNIKLEDIINNQELPWDYKWVSRNKTLSFKYILQNMDKKWDWRSIFNNNGIKNEFTQKLVND